MASQEREWTIPAPLRALLWWPATAFVLVLITPDTAAGAIAVAGGVLAVLGGLSPAFARWTQRSHGVGGVAVDRDPPVVGITAVETAEMSPLQRAA